MDAADFYVVVVPVNIKPVSWVCGLIIQDMNTMVKSNDFLGTPAQRCILLYNNTSKRTIKEVARFVPCGMTNYFLLE